MKLSIVSIDGKIDIIADNNAKILGTGGSKMALDVGHGYVLMMPGGFFRVGDSMPDWHIRQCGRKSWHEVVDREVYYSEQFKSIGLLTTNNTKVQLIPIKEVSQEDTETAERKHEVEGRDQNQDQNQDQDQDQKGDDKAPALAINLAEQTALYAYLSTSFDSMKEVGRYVIDMKNNDSTTWKGMVFPPDIHLNDPEIWKPVLAQYIVDAAKRCLHGWIGCGDSLSFCLEKHEDKSLTNLTNPPNYHLRAISFDFDTSSLSFKKDSEINESKIHHYLICGIEAILFYEVEARTGEISCVLDQESELVKENVSSALLGYAQEIIAREFPDIKYVTIASVEAAKRESDLLMERNNQLLIQMEINAKKREAEWAEINSRMELQLKAMKEAHEARRRAFEEEQERRLAERERDRYQMELEALRNRPWYQKVSDTMYSLIWGR